MYTISSRERVSKSFFIASKSRYVFPTRRKPVITVALLVPYCSAVSSGASRPIVSGNFLSFHSYNNVLNIMFIRQYYSILVLLARRFYTLISWSDMGHGNGLFEIEYNEIKFAIAI